MTTPAQPDHRRSCERVTDGRCMFETSTCTPTCHLDWGAENQPATPQPNPAAELRAAAQELRSPTNPGLTPYIALMPPGLGEALAAWLERAARHEDATVYAALACWPDEKDKAEREAWAASMVGHEAVAVARLILGGAS